MAWIASLVGAGASAASSNKSDKGNKKGTAAQIAAQQKAYADAKAGLGPYAGMGPEAVNRLGALMGLEGYRTKSDISLRELLANKPVLGSAGIVKKSASGFEGLIEKSEGASTLGDVYGKYGAPGIKKGGGVTGYFGKKRKKRGEQQAVNEAAKQVEYTAALAAWETQKAELEKQRDIELQTYDPTSELRKTPGYQYRYDTGLTSANNQLNRLGISQSGRAQKELTQYGQNFGSNEFQNEFNRLTGISSGGQNAATTLANVSIGQGSALSDIYGTQARNNSQYYGNLNEGIQGSLANFQYGKGRRNSSYGSNNSSYPRGNTDADTYGWVD